ncbi:MAG: DUF3419 family protein [candidate division Zixibacteria bacterium]|nr:DUF3419 family protein [candidate division Zixibacteria bacterium]
MAVNYAQCWEDTAVLRRALRIGQDDDILSVASGGDNTFALLLDDPRSVTAVDCNLEQIHLVELKMAAIRTLDYDDFTGFLGASLCDRRSIYKSVRSRLSPQAREYWDRRLDQINRGVIHCGKFERYLSTFRRYILPLIINRRGIDEFVRAESTERQKEIFMRRFDSWRWRLLFRLMFSRRLLGWFGRCPEAFSQVGRRNIADELLKRTEHGLTEVPAVDNYIVRYALTGNYDLNICAPEYLLPANFHILRERLDRLTLVHGSLQSVLEQKPADSYSAFNLSDVFEYLNAPQVEGMLQSIHRCAGFGSRLAFWTMFRQQSIPGPFNHRFTSDTVRAHELSKDDRGFFYGSFNIWQMARRDSRDSSVNIQANVSTGVS